MNDEEIKSLNIEIDSIDLDEVEDKCRETFDKVTDELSDENIDNVNPLEYKIRLVRKLSDLDDEEIIIICQLVDTVNYISEQMNKDKRKDMMMY